MKRKKLLIIVSVLVVIAITVVVAITQSPKWSRLSFEAVIQETTIQPDGEAIPIDELQPGYSIKVTWENSFIVESPFYYHSASVARCASFI